MKAVIISGSERRNGVTAYVSELIQDKLYEKNVHVNVIYLCDQKISACDGCGGDNGCNYRQSPCEKYDDMPHIIKMMCESDIIIYTCPVHAFGISHLMQIFLERAGVGYLRFDRPLVNKIGGCVIVGRKYSLGSAHDQIINNMLLNRMIIPGAGFPVLIHGCEKTKGITDIEESVALEQMVDRLVEIRSSVNVNALNFNHPNERKLKEIMEKDSERVN